MERSPPERGVLEKESLTTPKRRTLRDFTLSKTGDIRDHATDIDDNDDEESDGDDTFFNSRHKQGGEAFAMCKCNHH